MISTIRDMFKHVSEDFSSSLSKEYFNSNYGFRNIPVIFRQAFQEWNIKKAFSENSLLRSSIADFPVEIRKLNTNILGADTERFTLKEYLNYVKRNDSPDYYFTFQFRNSLKELDFISPDFFRCWYRSASNRSPKVNLRWLYVGSDKTQTKLHQDVWLTNAWNYLISGRKIWFFYSNTLTPIIKSNLDQYEFESYLSDPISFKSRKVQPLVCIQNPGDLVFTPGAYWHSAYNIGLTYSVTENFINETNYDNVLRYFEKIGSASTLKSLQSIVRSEFNKD